jgi:hypothetical protein
MEEAEAEDGEPGYEWLQELAEEAAVDEICPDGYDWYPVRRRAMQLSEQFKQSGDGDLADHYRTLREETTLSEREAEVVAFKRVGLTHNAIATYYGILDEGTVNDEQHPTSPSTVDEYSRRAGEKYRKAKRTAEELAEIYAE